MHGVALPFRRRLCPLLPSGYSTPDKTILSLYPSREHVAESRPFANAALDARIPTTPLHSTAPSGAVPALHCTALRCPTLHEPTRDSSITFPPFPASILLLLDDDQF